MNIFAAILAGFGQYGPALIKSIVDLWHGNPQGGNEADDAYVARIGALIEAKAKDTTAMDAEVENEKSASPGSDDQPPH